MKRDDETMTELLISEPDIDHESPREGAGPSAPSAAASASRGLILVAGLLIIVPAAVGLYILRSGATPPPPGAEIEQDFAVPGAADAGSDDITSADLLRPANAGTGRIRYQVDGESADLANGGAIALPGGSTLHVTVSPYPPTDFDTDVSLELTDADGAPVTDASISSEWDMVMVHGPFYTTFEHRGEGRYGADTFDFFMYGPWQLNTTVTTADGEALVKLAIFVWPE